MENKAIARTLRLLSQLMELHNENPFKIKSVANAAFKVDKLPFAIKEKSLEEIGQIDGLGKSISGKVWELLQTGTMTDLQTILTNTPDGIVEMLGIKGIGPKKIAVIWRDLAIENIGELYYACNENRLIEAKGFGLKTQDEIRKIIEFKMAAEGKFLYAQAEPLVNKLFEDISVWLNQVDPTALLGVGGEYRRCLEIIDEIELVLGAENVEQVAAGLASFEPLEFKPLESELLELEASQSEALEFKPLGSEPLEFEPLNLESPGFGNFEARTPFGLKVRLQLVSKSDFYLSFFKLTGSPSHVGQVLALAGEGKYESEHDIYTKAGLAYVEPELREGLDELALAKSNALPVLITDDDLKGSLHNHSTWSDGVNTLEEMALYCKDHLQLEYLGMCDHSKSAFYANGLNEQRIYAQHKEIDELNSRLAPFKIFKGIESDILYDGSLDYPEEILKTFDFVVASVHSILRMDEEKATSRLVTAIENPYTTILGHPTGRLLLSRKGYPIDYKKVIDACAANNVVIEINANPLRLDLDWRWHRYALEKGVLLSINPDAHRVEGHHDMRYGVLIGRKGGLQATQCLNAFSIQDISQYFHNKK